MMDQSHRRVIFASSLGTVFEWYDFYLYGALTAIISKHFFSGVANDTTAFIFALLVFAAGFAAVLVGLEAGFERVGLVAGFVMAAKATHRPVEGQAEPESRRVSCMSLTPFRRRSSSARPRGGSKS